MCLSLACLFGGTLSNLHTGSVSNSGMATGGFFPYASPSGSEISEMSHTPELEWCFCLQLQISNCRVQTDSLQRSEFTHELGGMANTSESCHPKVDSCAGACSLATVNAQQAQAYFGARHLPGRQLPSPHLELPLSTSNPQLAATHPPLAPQRGAILCSEC